MSEIQSQDVLLRAFRAVAAGGAAPTPISFASLYEALSETAAAMRAARQPVERVVARVKATAAEAGVRETHDRVVTNAVLWAIDYYYRDDIEFLLSVGVEQTRTAIAPHDRSIAARPPTVESAI